MKYIISYTRTLTHTEEIEAQSFEDAQQIADETQERMLDVEYNCSDEENEVESKFIQECQTCHESEAFADFTCCQSCLPDEQMQEYMIQANHRMLTERNICERCSRLAFHCQYGKGAGSDWYILCSKCLPIVSALGGQ